MVAYLVSVAFILPAQSSVGEHISARERLPLLVKVPWTARYCDRDPFPARDLADGVYHLLPLDPEEHGFIRIQPMELGEWRAFLRVIGGLDEGVIWIALQAKGQQAHLAVVVVTISYSSEPGDLSIDHDGPFVMTRELLDRHVSVAHVPEKELKPQGIRRFVEAVDYCRTAGEPLVYPSTKAITSDHRPAVELRLVGNLNDVRLQLRDDRSERWWRILEAMDALLPRDRIPFPLPQRERVARKGRKGETEGP
jgi:hypothetical protein